MKTITCLFAIAGLTLAFSPRSLAQDAPTRPLQDQPSVDIETQPSPSAIKETPTPKASPESKPKSQTPPATTAEKSPAKTEKAAAKTEKTTGNPAATPTKTGEKPAAKAEKTAAAERRGRARNSSADAAQLKRMEKEWEASFNDPAVIERIVADDFVGTSPGGKIITKRSMLNEVTASKTPSPSNVAHHLDVHFYGPNIAVVVGAAKQIDRDKAGKKVEHNYRFTDTWVQRDGKWQCVASQAILVPKR